MSPGRGTSSARTSRSRTTRPSIAALGIGPGDRVLEVGGASNAFARADVVCDLTFGATGQRNGSPGVFTAGTRYVEAPVESLPFGDGEFDFVICRQVLEHVADPRGPRPSSRASRGAGSSRSRRARASS